MINVPAGRRPLFIALTDNQNRRKRGHRRDIACFHHRTCNPDSCVRPGRCRLRHRALGNRLLAPRVLFRDSVHRPNNRGTRPGSRYCLYWRLHRIPANSFLAGTAANCRNPDLDWGRMCRTPRRCTTRVPGKCHQNRYHTMVPCRALQRIFRPRSVEMSDSMRHPNGRHRGW